MSFILAQFLTGLASASSLFLVASGLSVIFGVTRIVNFAHGSLSMLGTYLAVTLVPLFGVGSVLGFWGGVLAAALCVGVFGGLLEVAILRRLYGSFELFPLLATFGVVLVVQDATLALWGPTDILGPLAPGLDGTSEVFGLAIPQYDLVLIALGPLVLGFMLLLLRRTRWGVLVRAATEDREMLGALGVNQKLLFTSVFVVGAFLAGLGGAVQIPREPANLLMDLNIIAEAFVVVVVGGLGSLTGAYLAAVLIGEIQAFGIVLFPEITLVIVFLVMAVVLAVRPWGLLGRPEPVADSTLPAGAVVLRPMGKVGRLAVAAAVATLAALAWLAGPYYQQVASEILVFALFAASLQFVTGVGGIITFGHAAYFGLGAYGAALMVRHAGLPMEFALLAAPAAGGIGALLFGWFSVRLGGAYLAMLTLAFAQILWSAASQWYAVTGGDNGILGVWPSPWASDPATFFLVVLVVCVAGLAGLRWTAHTPFGYALRAGRDSPRRSAAIGIDVGTRRWAGFALGGVFAGLAGGLYAFLKGSVFPGVLAIPTSVDGLVMVLLGGIQSLTGPWIGAAVFVGLKTLLASATDYWRIILGTVIILAVTGFPQGIAGTLADWTRREGR